MITEERYRQILKYLDEKKSASVTELVELLETSESTIRRDLNSLAGMNRLKKVHGGAMSIEADLDFSEKSVETKNKLFMEEKEEIARYAASTLVKNDFVFIDAGTTTEKMIDFIEEKDIVVVTNGTTHARKLAAKGIKAYIVGGRVKHETEAVVGAAAIDFLRRYNFTKSYLGTNGISFVGGFSTPDVDEAGVKSMAIERSYVSFVLADHSKFVKEFPITFAQLSDLCIITDVVMNDKYKEASIINEVAK